MGVQIISRGIKRKFLSYLPCKVVWRRGLPRPSQDLLYTTSRRGRMKGPFDRRSFLKIAGTSFGIGVVYSAFPASAAGGETGEMFNFLGKQSGERVTPF